MRDRLRLQDNYDEQMQRLRLMCEDERLIDEEVTVTLKFTYQGTGSGRARTLARKDRVEAALRECGLIYTMTQDPESTFLDPVFVVFLVGPTWRVFDFYESIGER